MHEELSAVIRLWETDRAALAAEERLAALDAAISAAAARVAQVGVERAAVDARRAKLATEERELQKRLDDVSTRRARTQALIDAGKATDFLVATRQVEAMAAQKDELETHILEILEEQEGLAARQQELDRSATLAAAREREARADREAQADGLRAELARLAEERGPRWGALHREAQTRYRNLRTLKQKPLSLLASSTCTACHRSIPPQMVNELRRGLRAHTCPGCLRWLYENEEPAAG